MALDFATRRALIRRLEYSDKVMSYDPIVCWMLDEKDGVVAHEQLSGRGICASQAGAHVVGSLGNPGIGDGRTSPFYDGTNHYTDIHTATFQGRFNGSEGSIVAWACVFNAGVWTDGTGRFVIRLRVDANNAVYLQRSPANNQFNWVYTAGGVTQLVALGGMTEIGWMCIGMSWSASTGAGGEVRAYYQGQQTGATQVGLGVWAGLLLAGVTCIGASSTAPTSVWNGYLARVAIFARPLSAGAFADLAMV